MSCQIVTGSFTNTASTPQFVEIKGQINKFYLKNLTRSGITARGISGSLTSDRIVEAYFNPSLMSNGSAQIIQNGTVAGSLAPTQNGALSSGGISLYDSSVYSQGATITINSFVPGSPTVFTCGSAHGFVVGDNVRIVSLASAPELGGLVMTVTAVGGGGTTFTTLLNSTNSLTSTGSVYKVGNVAVQDSSLYYPQYRAIATVSLANPMVVTTLVQQNYQVGDVVRFLIPTAYGMQQLNSTTNGLPLEFTVSAVNNAVGTQSVTFANTDSSAYTAFAYAAAASYPYGLPVMIPQGAGNTNNLIGVTPTPLPYANQNILGFARQNTATRGVLIGVGGSVAGGGIIGSTVDAWDWTAVTSTQAFN